MEAEHRKQKRTQKFKLNLWSYKIQEKKQKVFFKDILIFTPIKIIIKKDLSYSYIIKLIKIKICYSCNFDKEWLYCKKPPKILRVKERTPYPSKNESPYNLIQNQWTNFISNLPLKSISERYIIQKNCADFLESEL